MQLPKAKADLLSPIKHSDSLAVTQEMPLAGRAAYKFFFGGILHGSTDNQSIPPGDRSGARRQISVGRVGECSWNRSLLRLEAVSRITTPQPWPPRARNLPNHKSLLRKVQVSRPLPVFIVRV